VNHLWPNCPKLPRPPAAVLASLDFRQPHGTALARLNEREWRAALDFADRAQLTLALRARHYDSLPQWVRDRMDQDLAKNRLRLAKIEELYRALGRQLDASGIEFLALKGLTHCPAFTRSPELRLQYDIDLLVPRDRLMAARDAVCEMGYESFEEMDRFPTDHLPALIRKTGWEWRGDFFDPEIPIAVELHFRLWNGDLERLPLRDPEEFWNRRVRRRVAAAEMAVLGDTDALGYASLHWLRHVLRGSAKAFHGYEIAGFLDSQARQDDFWQRWREMHSAEFRRLQAVTFRLAAEWFGCALHPIALEETERLPESTRLWFSEYAASPVTRLYVSSKDEIWLHLSLLDSWRDALRVARRRLLPGRLPGPVDAVHIPDNQMNWRRRVTERMRYAAYVGVRARHHAAALPGALAGGVRWWWKTNGLGRQFWIFLTAAVAFNFGLFIFVLLYNLRLIDLGFREDLLGTIGSAGAIGCVAGTIPAAVAVRRFGLRNAMLGSLGGIAVLTVLRALAVSAAPLVALSFANGLFFAVWAVVLAPSIAAAVDEKRRPMAFSLFFATMLAVGVAGGWAGGKLPLWMHGKQPPLLLAAGLAALALWPASRLRLPQPAREARIYPRSPFLLRYLLPFALWNLATGAFNPFFNAYFARLHFPVERIGAVFSAAQIMQVLAVFLAPWIFRRFGLVTGIACMMAATAMGLGGLAAQPSGAAAALAYMFYSVCQWMSEPGLNTLLMNRVDEGERGGASALNYLVAFSAQAVAAFFAGRLLARFGYPAVLCGAALVATLAAVLLRQLLDAPARLRECAREVLLGEPRG
jgi:MFS family permease